MNQRNEDQTRDMTDIERDFIARNPAFFASLKQRPEAVREVEFTPAPEQDIRRCIHCGGRQRTEESLQRDFDGVLDERVGLQIAMQQAIDIIDSPDPKVRNRVRMVLADALEVLVPVVENHPKPETFPASTSLQEES